MKSSKSLHDLSELIQFLPESIQQELLKEEKKKPSPGHDGKGKALRIALETKGRKGKAVTLVSGFDHNPDTIEKIAKTLKQHCGAGGTVKGRIIEIQGDMRVKLRSKLTSMNYLVK